VLRKLNISRKVVETLAKERRADSRAQFMLEQDDHSDHTMYNFVDEISKDDRSYARLQGYGYVGLLELVQSVS
jgi:hypothetical protein